MSKIRIYSYTIFMILTGLMVLLVMRPITHNTPYEAVRDMTLIAHAGGGLYSGTYSNTREAFDLSAANGFNLIEADFNWTLDNHLVLTHDWDRRYYQYYTRFPRLPENWATKFPNPAESVPQFSARRMNYGLTSMTLPDLFGWLRAHPNVKIITDIKQDNIEGLLYIKEAAPDLKSRFIVQIYQTKEYEAAAALGYKSIVFTNYVALLPALELAEFAAQHPLFAITIPQRLADASSLMTITQAGTPVWVHTIDRTLEASRLKDMGVSGLYTNFLVPSQP